MPRHSATSDAASTSGQPVCPQVKVSKGTPASRSASATTLLSSPPVSAQKLPRPSPSLLPSACTSSDSATDWASASGTQDQRSRGGQYDRDSTPPRVMRIDVASGTACAPAISVLSSPTYSAAMKIGRTASSTSAFPVASHAAATAWVLQASSDGDLAENSEVGPVPHTSRACPLSSAIAVSGPSSDLRSLSGASRSSPPGARAGGKRRPNASVSHESARAPSKAMIPASTAASASYRVEATG